MPRLLPGLDADETSVALKIFTMKMEKEDGSSHEERIRRVEQTFLALFGHIGQSGVEEVLGALPGWTRDLEEFMEEEEEVSKLEALDGEFLTLSEARPWRWVNPDWDGRDLEIWRKLSEGPSSWNSEEMGEWRTPVPRKSLDDLLYNSKRIVDGLSQPDKWEEEGNRTGLVLGNIQSGKTASMLGVSSIALDASVGGGYKVLIVLGGHTENLRRQTQERFEIFKKTERLNIHFGTSTMENGDLPNLEKDNARRRRELKERVSNAVRHLEDDVPVIWVVKKNAASLSGMKAILKGIAEHGLSPETLILDDESDHSSLNTKLNDPTGKGSRIHGLICDLREVCEKNCYVGYTATPQGVLLADPGGPLFPDDLLWIIEPHGKYIGADHFFNEMSHLMISTVREDEWPNYGDDAVDMQLEEERKAGKTTRLKELQREVLDGWRGNGAPISIKKALIDFVLIGGIRWNRADFPGEEAPWHSLMFHVEREIFGQKMLGGIIDDAWEECREAFDGLISNGLEYEEGNKYHRMIKERWERLENNVEAVRPDPKDRPSIHDLPTYFRQIIESVGEKGQGGGFLRRGLRIINSEDGSDLPYHLNEGDKDRPPKAMILIGGDLLSRGLTVEGLTVSYYLRLARKPTFDTELQRCRWFGAKKGDEDVLTLWIQKRHQRMFKDLADHNKDLVRQVRETVLRGFSPLESLIILHARDSYQVTGYSKRGGRVEKLEDSYSGNTTQFKEPSVEFANRNMESLNDYLDGLRGVPEVIFGNRGKLWEDVDANGIINLLKGFKHETDRPKQIEPKELARYLKRWRDLAGSEGIADFPKINVVQRFGEGDSEISKRGRETDGSDGLRTPRRSFKTLAAGASGKFSGDWWMDAVNKNKADMDMEKLEGWFERKPEGGKERKVQRDFYAARKSGAPILFVFYKLDRTYVNRKSPNGSGEWHLNEDDHDLSHLIAEDDLVGFISSLPKGGPGGGGIVNRLIAKRSSKPKMIDGRMVDGAETDGV